MKKILSITLLSVVFLSIASFAQATEPTPTIVSYPELKGAVVPGEASEGEELPQLIKYIFTFSLGVVGILGLLMIIYGGFIYLTSVGNPQKASEGKDRIFSALLGIILLLGSYLLLNIINPDLLRLGISLKPTEVIPENTVTHSWNCYCCDGKNCKPNLLEECIKKATKNSADLTCADACETRFGSSRSIWTLWLIKHFDKDWEFTIETTDSCK